MEKRQGTIVVSPQGAEAWIEYLVRRKLPVRNSVQQRLKRQVRDSNVNLRDLGKLIKSDPVLCLYMVKTACQLHAAKGSEVTGIDHAISSLGLDHIEDVAFRVPAIKLNPTSTAQKMFFRSIANSHHAAVQARHWTQSRNSLFVDESYLAALFYGVGYWMLWHYAPLHMSEVQRKQREEGVDVVLAESDVLGCTVQEISKGLISDWGLSELAVTSLDHDNSPSRQILQRLHMRTINDPRLSDQELRDLNHLVQEKFFPVKIANWLCQTTQYGWHTTKAMKIVDIINDYLKSALSETLASLHQNCAAASREYHIPGTMAPAAEMLFIRSNTRPNYKLGPREIKALPRDIPQLAGNTSSAPAGPARDEPEAQAAAVVYEKPSLRDKVVFTQTAERLLKGSDLYSEPRHILQGTMQALHEGLGMERAAMFLIQQKGSSMKTAFTKGVEKQDAILSFYHSLEITSLFKRLSEKPSCIWITPDNRAKMLRLLPENYHGFVPESGALIMSIFIDKKPIAVVHADRGNAGKILSDFHHERFRYVCSAASLALKRMITGQ